LELIATDRRRVELYDLAKDRCEQHDVAKSHPDRVRNMGELWQSRDEEFVRVRERRRQV